MSKYLGQGTENRICIFWRINNKFVCILWKWFVTEHSLKRYVIFLHITSKTTVQTYRAFEQNDTSFNRILVLSLSWALKYFVREEGSAIFSKYYKPSKHNLTRVIYQSSLLRVAAVSAFLLAFFSILIFSLAPFESQVGHQFPLDQVETRYCFSFSHAEN